MKSLKISLAFLLVFFGSQMSFAAPGPPTSGPVCWPPPCVPIDGGVVFLIAAGAIYGLKKIYDLRKTSQGIS
jgi:hypothetical protein